MPVYDLYLESGPKKRKTMVHVLDLLGCVATGPTTEEALAATPAAIRAYRRFLHRRGEVIDPEAPFETRVAVHLTEGAWLGNGSPYIAFAPDFDPLTQEETERLVVRLRWLIDELAEWADTQSPEQLDAPPVAGSRTNRAILLHVLGAQGPSLAAALAGAPGFSRLHSAAERGEIPLPVALVRAGEMVEARIQLVPPERRNDVREITGRAYTLRKALRRMIEHDWEHLAELSRHPSSPQL